MDEREHRIRERAHRLWEEEGRPDGRADQHWFAAKEMIAIEESQATTLRPIDDGMDAEPIEALVNAGEFPTLTDQGEAQIPHAPGTPEGGEIPPPHVDKPAKAAAKAADEAKPGKTVAKPAPAKPAPAKPAAKAPAAKTEGSVKPVAAASAKPPAEKPAASAKAPGKKMPV